MQVYKTKANKFSGSDFREVHEKAFELYKSIKKQTKRRPYIRSAYFSRNKIFIDLFWQHLFEKKNWRDRMRRLKFFGCAVELLRHSHFEPITRENPNKQGEILHRFFGITPDSDLFYVQVKEERRNGQKFLISIFPDEK